MQILMNNILTNKIERLRYKEETDSSHRRGSLGDSVKNVKGLRVKTHRHRHQYGDYQEQSVWG